MARARTKRNFLGFGKKTTHSPKLVQDAYEAGRRSGDTSQFRNWIARQGDDLHGSFKRRLEKQYRAGVQSLWKEEKREAKRKQTEAKKEAVAEKRAEAKEEKERESSVVADSASALNNLGMKKTEALKRARAAYKTGDSIDDIVRKVTKKNPAKFDRCVAGVKQSLKKARRPGNAYAICTKAGTRNPSPYLHIGLAEVKAFDARAEADGEQAWRSGKKLSSALMNAALKHAMDVMAYRRGVTVSAKDAGQLAGVYKRGFRRAFQGRLSANPKSPKQLRAAGWRLVDTFKQRSAAEGITGNYKPFRLVSRSGKWEVWTRQPGTTANPKKNSKYSTLLWEARQGNSTAEIYKAGSNFLVEFSNGQTVTAKSFAGAQAIARIRLHDIASNPVPKEVQVIPGVSYADTIARASQRIAAGVKKSAAGALRKIKKLGTKKNPADVAVKRYEEFHGFPVNEVREVERGVHVHSVTYGLARLIALNVIDVNGKQLPPLISAGFKFEGPIRYAYLHFDRSGDVLTPEKMAATLDVDPEDIGYWVETKVDPVKVVWLSAGEDNKQLFLSGGDQALDLKALGFTDRDFRDSMLIGTIIRVWYRTRKKFEGDEEVDFYHDFGKEGSKGVYPVLAYKPKDQPPSLEVIGGRYSIAAPDKGLGGLSPGIVG